METIIVLPVMRVETAGFVEFKEGTLSCKIYSDGSHIIEMGNVRLYNGYLSGLEAETRFNHYSDGTGTLLSLVASKEIADLFYSYINAYTGDGGAMNRKVSMVKAIREVVKEQPLF